MRKRFVRSKRGSAMVEAAMVFPLVLLSVVTVVYILIYLYMETVGQAHLHMTLRAEEASRSGTARALGFAAEYRPADKFGKNAFGKEPLLYTEGFMGADRIYGEVGLPRPGGGLLSGGGTKALEGRVYVVDEEIYIRALDLLRQDGT